MPHDSLAERATCCALLGFDSETVVARTGEAFLEEFEGQCEKAVRKLLKVPPGGGVEGIAPDEDEALFLIVDPDAAPLALVAEGVRTVHRRFPWLVMVLLTREELPTDEHLDAWQLTNPRKLEPALEPGEELNAQRVVGALEEMLNRAGGQRVLGAA